MVLPIFTQYQKGKRILANQGCCSWIMKFCIEKPLPPNLFTSVLYSMYWIWNMYKYTHKKQSLLILKSIFLWMKKLSDPDAFSSSEWSTRLISPRHIWHPCLSVMEGKHAICLTLFPIILICINQNFKKNERKFRGLYVINPLYVQSCYKFATPYDKVGSKRRQWGRTGLVWHCAGGPLLTNKITTACQLISSQLSTIRRPHFC